jgi:hypothetical protein
MLTPFDRVVEQAKALSPAEQRRLRSLLDEWVASPPPAATEEGFAQELLREGILDQAPLASGGAASCASYQPVEVVGKPVSETIIEERR